MAGPTICATRNGLLASKLARASVRDLTNCGQFRCLKWAGLLVVSLLVSTTVLIAEQIPAGTIVPIMLTTTIDAAKAKPGQAITGKVMQTVKLPSGVHIRWRTKVLGHVIAASSAKDGTASRLKFAIDTIIAGGHEYHVATNLRAMTDMTLVWQAEIPRPGPDDWRIGEPFWTTVPKGGQEVVYSGMGSVIATGTDKVGEANSNRPSDAAHAPGVKCRGDLNSSGKPQALWFYSPDACGLYSFDDLMIVHAGRTNPIGEIELESKKDVKLPEGTALLLTVDVTTSNSSNLSAMGHSSTNSVTEVHYQPVGPDARTPRVRGSRGTLTSAASCAEEKEKV